jgi:hypothetical protein
MNSLTNKYVIGGIVFVLLIIIIYNMELKVHTQEEVYNLKIAPQIVRERPSSASNNNLSPNEHMLQERANNSFPKTDEYMSPALRAQINELHKRFYYDNCSYAPIE